MCPDKTQMWGHLLIKQKKRKTDVGGLAVSIQCVFWRKEKQKENTLWTLQNTNN